MKNANDLEALLIEERKREEADEACQDTMIDDESKRVVQHNFRQDQRRFEQRQRAKMKGRC